MIELWRQISEFLAKLLSVDGFPRRWDCLNPSQFHGYLHIVSDVAIWGAYTAIPLVISYFVVRRRDVPFPRILWLFVAFILACGTTHLLEAILFYWPVYRLSALVKFITAVVSWTTVFALIMITPQAMRLPGIARLNEQLAAEVHDRRIAEQLLLRRNLILAAEQEASLDGILIVDEDGWVTEANRQFRELWGFSHQELQRTPATGVLARIAAQLRSPLQQFTSEAGEPFHAELELTDGRVIDAHSTMLQASDGSMHGLVWHFRDVTERRLAERTLREAKELAENANRTKSHFLANVSHELRTPLNGIVGIIDLMHHDSIGKPENERTQMLKRSGDQLLRVINDLLDLSKIEAGKITLSPMVFSPREQIEGLIESFSPQATAKGLELSWSLEMVSGKPLPDLVEVDAFRLRQVLTNLLDNAIKFTQAGSVRLRLSWQSHKKPDLMYLRYEVSDTGIGIPPSKQDQIFRPFEQADSSTTRDFGGTGLGLAICRQLVNMMGGQLELDSTPGRGSTFRFAVEARIVDASEPVNGTSSAVDDEVFELPPMRLLLAEDNVINQTVVEQMLLRDGHTVKIVADGRSAVEAMANEDFDAVLMDVQMPVMDGWQATTEIRQKEARGKKRVPIIALTARAMSGERQRCRDAGMDDFLSKPVDWNHLRAALGRSLRRQGRTDLAAQQPQAPADETKPHERLTETLDRFGRDPKLLAEMCVLYKKDAARIRENIQSGLDSGTYQTVARAAHELVGASGLFGAKLVTELARQIESAAGEERREEIERLLPVLDESLSQMFKLFDDWQSRLDEAQPSN